MKTLHSMRKHAVTLLSLSALTVAVCEKGHADGPSISGFVDTQYVYNFNKPADEMNKLRYYDAQDNSFKLSMVHLAFMGTMDKLGYNIEIDAGDNVDTNNSFDDNTESSFDIQEAYFTYGFTDKLGIKVGKFATFSGIELLESKDNPVISYGYLYHFAELYTHVGGVVTYKFNDMFDVAAGVVNGWDQAEDNNTGKTATGKIGMNFGDPLALTLSGYHGPEQDDASMGNTGSSTINGLNRSSIDLTGVTKIIPKVALWFQINHGEEELAQRTGLSAKDSQWDGFGIQPIISITDKFTIGARLEYFDDHDGARLGLSDENVIVKNYTIAPGYKLSDNLQVRGELRQDTSNKKIFTDDKGNFEDSQTTGSLQFIVTF